MGNSLPTDLLNAERTKLMMNEGFFMKKSYDFDSYRSFEDDEHWDKVVIRVHQARIECEHNGEVEVHQINCDFLIINQNHKKKEIVLGFMADKRIWKLQAQSIRQFLDFTTTLMHSRIPSWSVSPVCQVCSKTFGLGKGRHHCRNCGKNICKKCMHQGKFNIEGFYRLSKVCNNCGVLITTQISVIQEIQRNEIIRGDASSKSVLLPCPSRKS